MPILCGAEIEYRVLDGGDQEEPERDHEVLHRLAEMGWHTIVIWECELKPAVREKTLESLAFTLNHIYLEDHHIRRYELPEEVPEMVAEPEAERREE